MRNEGLKVWYVVNPPNDAVFVPVNSPEEAIKVIDEEAARQLQDKTIWGNAFGLVEPDGEEWTEWTHPNLGVEIGEYAQMLELGEVAESV